LGPSTSSFLAQPFGDPVLVVGSSRAVEAIYTDGVRIPKIEGEPAAIIVVTGALAPENGGLQTMTVDLLMFPKWRFPDASSATASGVRK
jgi:hypothetical protein